MISSAAETVLVPVRIWMGIDTLDPLRTGLAEPKNNSVSWCVAAVFFCTRYNPMPEMKSAQTNRMITVLCKRTLCIGGVSSIGSNG